MASKYNLLKKASIVNILDGYTKLGKYQLKNGKTISLSLPYLTSFEICRISYKEVRHYIKCTGNNQQEYMRIMLNSSFKNHSTVKVLSYIFSKHVFFKWFLKRYHTYSSNELFINVRRLAIRKINSILKPDNCLIKQYGTKFCVVTLFHNKYSSNNLSNNHRSYNMNNYNSRESANYHSNKTANKYFVNNRNIIITNNKKVNNNIKIQQVNKQITKDVEKLNNLKKDLPTDNDKVFLEYICQQLKELSTEKNIDNSRKSNKLHHMKKFVKRLVWPRVISGEVCSAIHCMLAVL